MKKRRPGPIIAVVSAIPLLLFVGYMTAFYIARPNGANEMAAWEWRMVEARHAGKMPYFYVAYQIDDTCREKLGLGPPWQPRYSEWPPWRDDSWPPWDDNPWDDK